MYLESDAIVSTVVGVSVPVEVNEAEEEDGVEEEEAGVGGELSFNFLRLSFLVGMGDGGGEVVEEGEEEVLFFGRPRGRFFLATGRGGV